MDDETSSDAEILRRNVTLADRRAVDVGCGRGAMVRAMRVSGARAIGIECAPELLAAARGADPDHAEDYLEGVGQDLPLADGAADLVCLFHSLHHIPAEVMDTALSEARRVLAPGGHLYAAEPLDEGESHALERLIDDETAVRAQAQRALDRALEAGFAETARIRYRFACVYRDCADYVVGMLAVDPTRRAAADAHAAEIAAAFRQCGTTVAEGRRIEYPILARILARD